MKRVLVAQGAEAKLYRQEGLMAKDRVKKSYRIPELDEPLRNSRAKREEVILKKLPGIAPAVIKRDGTSIEMEFIDGSMLKDILDSRPELAEEIGKTVAELHGKDIIHGDLTTSNILLDASGKIRLIDFGLSFISKRVEDRAVDIHLFRQALESKHVKIWESAFKLFLKGYKEKNPGAEKIMERFAVVESRGRNKQKY